MPSQQERTEDVKFYSVRISETSRFIGFGLLAVFYAIKVEPSGSLAANDCLVMSVGVFGALSVLFDYLQYVFGYGMVRIAQANPPDHSYSAGLAGWFFALKSWAFWLKQVTATFGSIIVIFLVLGT